MVKLSINNSKAIMAILLSGLAVVSNEYNNYLSKDNDDAISSVVKISNRVEELYKKKILSNNKVNYLDIKNDADLVFSYLEDNNINNGVCIKNVDERTGQQIDNSIFEIDDLFGHFVTYIKTEKNDCIVKLNPGKYKLNQIYNNMSYLPNDTIIYFEVKKDDISTITINNELANSGILLYNVDSQNGNNIEGLSVSIVNSNNSFMFFTTSKEPRCIRLVPDEYTLFAYNNITNQEIEYSFKVNNEKKLQKVVLEYDVDKIKMK